MTDDDSPAVRRPDPVPAPASALLADEETALLRRALVQWGGPARCGDGLAVGMGFAGYRDLLEQSARLRRALADDTPLTPADWARTLLAAEIAFVSDLAGAGVEWRTSTGLPDDATLAVLRSVQRKLSWTVRPYYGTTPGD